MSLRLAAALVISWLEPAWATYCEWHVDRFVRHRLNYTDDPWHFDIETTCTSVSLMTLLWGAIDDVGATALADALITSPQLEELTVGYNNIGDAGAISIANALKHVPKLRTLFLGWNNIGNAGAQALASNLRFLPELQELNLWWNNIGDAGVRALASALGTAPQFTRLSLAWNPVGDGGASAIAAALQTNQQLATISLAWSGITSRGAKVLAAAIPQATQLQELRLTWNDIGDASAMELAQAMIRLETSRGGLPVVSSGIPRSILEAARNASKVDQGDDGAWQSTPRDALRSNSDLSCKASKVDAVTCFSASCNALVVGNAKYMHETLPSAVLDDADRVAATLGGLGFSVSKLLDGTLKEMQEAIQHFFREVGPGSVCFFHFLGYSFQYKDDIFLLPIDFAGEIKFQMNRKAISMSWILSLMAERGASVNLLIMDADQTYHFRQEDDGEIHVVSHAPLPKGTFVAFASAPGTAHWLAQPESARPASGTHPSFTTNFMLELDQPGIGLEQIFKNVRRRVIEETSSTQVPWESSSLVSDFIINAGQRIPP